MRIKKCVLSLLLAVSLLSIVWPASSAAVIAAEDRTVIYTQNFDGRTTGSIFADDGGLSALMKRVGSSVSFEIGDADGTYSDSLKYTGEGAAASGGVLELPETITDGGKYRFSFSLYLTDTEGTAGSMPVIGLEAPEPVSDAQYAVLGCVVNGNIRRASISNTGGNLEKVEAGSWIDFETIVDMTQADKTISYTAKQNGEVVLDSSSHTLTDRADAKNPWPGELSFSGISVRTKNKNAAAFYFDNLLVEKIGESGEEPSPTEEPAPTDKPTAAPTDRPTAVPEPTNKPTAAPTDKSTAVPEPTDKPTEIPVPTDKSTEAPEPTKAPTDKPTAAPTSKPAGDPDWTELYAQNFDGRTTKSIFEDDGDIPALMTKSGESISLEIADADATYQDSLKCSGIGTSAGIIDLADLTGPLTAPNKYRFKFSLYLNSVTNPGSMPVIGLEATDPEVSDYAALGCIVNGNVRRANIGNNNGLLGKAKEGSWLEYETIVDMAAKTITYKVVQDGETIVDGGTAYVLSDRGQTTEWTNELSFSGISVRSKNGNDKPFYFDNLVVEKFTGDPNEPTSTPSVSAPTATPSSSDALFYVDFEDATRESLVSDYAYDDAGRGDASFVPRGAEDLHGDSMFFAKGVNGGSGYAFAFNSSSASKTPGITLSSGVYKFSFSIYPNDDTPVVALDGGSAQTYVPLASVSGGTARHANITDTSGSTVICSGLSNNEWVDFETIVDLDTSRISYQITQNGQLKGTKTVPLREHLGGEWSGAYAFKRIAVRTRNASQNGFYIDDIKMEKWSAAPSIGTDFITFTDALGNHFNPVSGQAVSPAVDSIALDFGYAADDEILNNISLSPEADFNISKQGSACVLTFNEYLEGDTDYTLFVPRPDGGYFTLNFKTEAEKTLTELRAVSKNGSQVDDISKLMPGDKFTVESSVVNMSGGAMDFTVVVAYYNGGRMTATDYRSLMLNDGGSLRSTEFTVPSEADGMTSMRCFLWDKMDSLAAYCGYLEIDGGEEESAAQAADIPYTADYDRTASKLSIEGVKTDADHVVLQILKAGKSFEIVPQKDDIMYHNQCVTADGAYSFDIEFADSDEGVHQAVLASSGGSTEREYMTLTLVTPEHFAQLYSDVNAAAAAGDIEAFAKIINENRAALGFEFGLTDGKVLYGELTDYINYVKSHPLDVNQEDDNNRIFKTYMTAYALNNGGIDNIDEYADQLYYTDKNVLPMYKELAVSDTIQKYFSKRLSDSRVIGLDGYETAFEQALVFTTVRYGDGYGDVKKVLTYYGGAVGITGTAPNTVYSGLLGKDFTGVEALRSAYNTLLTGGNNSNNAGGRGGGFGGGGGGFSSGGGTFGSGNTSVGEYSAETLPDDNKPQQLTVSFNDIEGVDWATEAILTLADLGIINGTGDGMFEPDNPVAREEFTKILVCAMGLAGSSYTENAFTDVADDAWYCGFVNIARENGIVRGIGNGEFGAGETITREDMATMLYNALRLRGLEMPAKELTFKDAAEISDYAKPAVAALYELGAVNGVSDTEFSPKETATRAQAAKVVYGVLDHLQ